MANTATSAAVETIESSHRKSKESGSRTVSAHANRSADRPQNPSLTGETLTTLPGRSGANVLCRPVSWASRTGRVLNPIARGVREARHRGELESRLQGHSRE